MLVAAAVCPCPPLLVPQVAAGAAAELDAARTAASDALAVLAAARPDRLVVVAPVAEAEAGPHPEGGHGSFRGFGVPVDVVLGAGGGTRLPAPLAVAAWLLDRVGWADAAPTALGVHDGLGADACLAEGRTLAAGRERTALLVMGDGSACRTLKAPGYLDDRAEPFDAGVARALGSADTAALAALDTELARDLKAAGRAPWQVLAGAAAGAGLGGRLLYEDAPYGVGYFVAAWS